MSRYTISRSITEPSRNGMMPEVHMQLLGTYDGKNEDAALEAYAKADHNASVAAALKKLNAKREDFVFAKVVE